jgi:hypothetical protein
MLGRNREERAALELEGSRETKETRIYSTTGGQKASVKIALVTTRLRSPF